MKPSARLLLQSIRSFGGQMRDDPVWLFEADPHNASCKDMAKNGVEVLPLDIPDSVRDYLFAGKVVACARAEELAGPHVQSLVWLSHDFLVLQPPLFLSLGPDFDAAFRPVHIKNIGIPAGEPLDAFWERVYDTIGAKDTGTAVESFVDVERIHPYYNSHAFAVNPSRGLMRRWFRYFEALVCNEEFQSGPCRDERHKVFLHQAVLSALLTTVLPAQRIRTLPPDYIYPYNLQQSVPRERRAVRLNDLVCIAYENRPLDPALVNDIMIDEPLKSWLSDHS